MLKFRTSTKNRWKF